MNNLLFGMSDLIIRLAEYIFNIEPILMSNISRFVCFNIWRDNLASFVEGVLKFFKIHPLKL
jgi:hypothetical protein